MVAIVAGNGLGLFNASNALLGSLGALGQAGLGQSRGLAYVNAANGNLLLQFQDHQLSGRGADLLPLRTYNSQGTLADGLGSGWLWDAESTVVYTGTQRNSNGTVTRTTGDGHVTVYSWNGTAYVSTEGNGAHDSMRFDSATAKWLWTDGTTREVERYNDSVGTTPGTLVSRTDASGNVVSYEFDSARRVTRITDQGSAQAIAISYTTVAGVLRVDRLETFEQTVDGSGRPTGTVSTTPIRQVQYGYDGSGRLTSVKTILNPAQGTPTFFTVGYTYDGASTRIASVFQSDGTNNVLTFASFTYVQVGSVFRVASVTDAHGTQSFEYKSPVAGRASTEITDAAGKKWTYIYDATTSQLVETRTPSVNGAEIVTKFDYDASGNLIRLTDARGAINYEYDARGNQTLVRDAFGNTLTRTFDASTNQLLTETRYTGVDPDGAGTAGPTDPLTTRYVYDDKQRLRFVITAEGRVSEYRYDNAGLLVRTVRYTAAAYDVSDLAVTAALTEAQLTEWVNLSAVDKRRVELTRYEYDPRGNLARRTDYARVGSDGEGVLDSATTVTEYIDDAHGRLLKTIAVRGAARDQRVELKVYAYDGLGREISCTNAPGSTLAATTTTVYDDVNRKITITNAANLRETRTFDNVGRLSSIQRVDQTPASARYTPPPPRVSRLVYDTAGRLRIVREVARLDDQGNDVVGAQRFSFYDALGRLQYSVDATGVVTAFEYNGNDQVTAQTIYAGRADTSAWTVSKTTLVIGGTNPDITPDAKDRRTSFTYDSAGRLSTQVDGAGTVTTTSYDGVSRVTQVSTGNRVTQYFYDRDGRQVGVVDPLGYLTESKYDASGRLVESVRYTQRSANAANVSGPVWNGINSRAARAGREFVYQLPAAYDADGDTVTYRPVSLPGWLSFDTTTLTLRGTPPTGFASVQVTLEASDGRSPPRTTTVSFEITAQNSPPGWARALPDAIVPTNTAGFSLQLPAASDAESTASQLTYSIDPRLLPPGLTFDAATLRISGTPTTAGTYAVTVVARDPQGLSSEKTFLIQVTNRGPIISVPADPSVTRTVAFNIPFPIATDPEGQALTYRKVSGPSWLTVNASTGTLTGRPPAGAVLGNEIVVLEVEDHFGEVSPVVFKIAVQNAPPTWAVLPAPPLIHAGAQFNYTPSGAVDPEGGALTYSAAGLPAGFSIDSRTGAITGRLLEVGSWTVTLTATDEAGGSVSRMTTITQTNNPPFYVGGLSDLQIRRGAFASLTVPPGTFADPDGDVMGPPFLASALPAGWTAGVIDGTFLIGSPTNATIGSSFSFTIGVKDRFGAAAFKTITIRVVASLTAGSAAESAAAVPAPRLLQSGALAPSVDVLATRRPSNTEGLHAYHYYDAEGRVTASIDERGFLSTMTYDESLNRQQSVRYLTPVTVAADGTFNTPTGLSQTTTTQFDALGRVSTIRGVDETVTRFEYDLEGRLVRTVQAEGTNDQRATRTRYSAFGEVTGTLRGVGDAWLAADPSRTLDEAIEQYGMRYQYDGLGRQISATDAKNGTGTDANGNRTLSFYDAQGRLTHLVNAKGEVTEMLYNVFGQVSSTRRYARTLTAEQLSGLTGGANTTLPLPATDAKDRVTSLEYDTRGLLTSSTDALGFTTTNTYDVFGQLDTQTRTIKSGGTPLTTTTQFGYDLNGALIARTADRGGLNFNAQWTYDGYGRLKSATDASGRVTSTSYLDSGRTIEVTDPLGRTVHSEYDAFGRVLRQVDALQMTRDPQARKATTYFYDDVNRKLVVTTPENVRVTTSRTRTGETLSIETGREGESTRSITYTYNKDGQVASATEAPGTAAERVTSYTYDHRGRVDTVTDARGTVVKYGYDELNRVITRQLDPSGLNLTTKYEFDTLGDQVAVTEAFGTPAARVTSYSYDAQSKVLQVVVDPQGLKLSTTYAYDGLGNVLQVSRGTLNGSSANQTLHVTMYEFDALGRRVREIVAPSSVMGLGSARARDLTTEYRYDTAGRLSRKIDANGNSTWFIYDAAGQLTHTVNALGEISQSDYDANGRVIHTRAYTRRINVNGFGDVVSSITPNPFGNDPRTFFVYDEDGRLRFTVRAELQGTWSVSENRFDASGNVIETRMYEKTIAEDAVLAADTAGLPGLSVADVCTQLRAAGYADTALGSETTDESSLGESHRTRFVYDAGNRLRFTVDGFGGVSEKVYDAAGNVITSIRYATRPTLGTFTESAIDAAVSRTDAANQVTHFAYDKAGRLRYTLRVKASDAQGHATQQLVREQKYDAAGRIVQTIAYATELGALANEDYSETQIQSAIDALGVNPLDHRTALVYDAAGREVYSVQVLRAGAQNVVRRQEYDALGHVIRSTAYARLIALDNFDLATLDSAVTPSEFANDARNRTTRFAYDAAGRLHFTVAADRTLSETVYDALGQVVETRRFDLQVPQDIAVDEGALVGLRAFRQVGDGVTRGEKYTYDLAGRVLTTTDANGFTETNAYNGLGQRTTRTDKNGNVWKYDYDRVGRTFVVTSPATLMLMKDGITRRTEEFQTRFYHDVFGQIIIKLEGVNTGEDRETNYVYDRLGQQTLLSLPGWYDAASGRVEQTNNVGNTRFQRTLETTYDALGNAVRTKLRTGMATFQNEYKTYDALGRLVHDIDALKNVTRIEYTSFGEQAAVTRFSVPLAGEPQNGAYWTLADIAGTQPQLASDTQKRTVQMSYDAFGRKIQVTQPAADRYFFSNTGTGAGATINAPSITSVRAAGVTTYAYNVFGEVIHEAVKLDDVGSDPGNTGRRGHWRDTFHYFDVMGRQTRMVNAANYQSAYEYDRLGNLKEVIEYANAGPAITSAVIPPEIPTPSDKDRITAYTYDALNRLATTTRKNLRYASLGQNGRYDLNNTGRTAGAVVETLAYDGLGHVTARTDALGNVTTTSYDARGRIERMVEPARMAASNSAVDPFHNMVTVSPTISYTYNAFGELAVQSRSTDGVSGLTTFITNVYDYAGNVIAIFDARGSLKNRQYDYSGRLTKETQEITSRVGQWDVSGTTRIWRNVHHILERRYTYDALGRSIAVTDAFFEAGVLQQSGHGTIYNAFGEVTDELRLWGLGSSDTANLKRATMAHFAYDDAGHVKSKSAADGTTQYYYNLVGQVTRQEQQGNNSTADGTGTRITETGYDVLGRAIVQRLPSFGVPQVGGFEPEPTIVPITPVREQTFDRWDNVVSRTEGGYVLNSSQAADITQRTTTTYEYNQDNQLTAEHLPTVTAVRRDGSAYQANLTHSLFYDLAGHTVQETDTVPEQAQSLRTRSKNYDAAGHVISITDATGNTTRYAYDANGNRVGTLTALGTVFVDTFDGNGNVIAHSVLRVVNGSGHSPYNSFTQNGTPTSVRLNTYEYDQANRRIAAENRVEDAPIFHAMGDWTFTEYDERNFVRANFHVRLEPLNTGIIVLSRPNEPGRLLNTFSYDVFGNKISETDAAGRIRSWAYNWSYDSTPSATDYTIGRLRSMTQGGRTVTYDYNDFGQVKKETYTGRGIPDGVLNDRSYGFLENGLLTSITDNNHYNAAGEDFWHSLALIRYRYTVKGERAYESFHSEGSYGINADGRPETRTLRTIDRSTELFYDAQGRISSLSSSSGASNRSSLNDLTYSYDELGNRRRVHVTYTPVTVTPQGAGVGAVTTSDKWFDYDEEGRMTVVDGRVENGQFVKREGTVTLTYDADGRRATSETDDGFNAKTVREEFNNPNFPSFVDHNYSWHQLRLERYTYNDLNYLQKVEQSLKQTQKFLQDTFPITGGPDDGPPPDPVALPDGQSDWILTRLIQTDLLGNVTLSDLYTNLRFNSQQPSDVTHEWVRRIQSEYTSLGLKTQWTRDVHPQSDGSHSSIVTNQYDEFGVLRSYNYQQGVMGLDMRIVTPTLRTDYTYTYSDEPGGYKEREITAQSSQTNQSTVTRNHYDARGNLVRQTIDTPSTRARQVLLFGYDLDGHVITKDVITTNVLEQSPFTGAGNQDYFYALGQQLGVIGSGELKGTTQFGSTFTPISSAYPGSSPGTYTVQSGDTLASIAQQAYGDASLWYLIGDANSLNFGPTESLTSQTGKTWRIPNIGTNLHSNSTTFRPYNAASIIGSGVPAPGPVPPPPTEQCSTTGRIVAGVVILAAAIVATVATQGAAAAVLGESVLAGMAAAGIGAAAGSAAAQLTALSLTGQSLDHISGRDVLESAFGAALGAGVGALAKQAYGGANLASRIFDAGGNFIAQTVVHTAVQRDFDDNPFLDLASQAGGAALLGPTFQKLDGANFKPGSALQQAAVNAVGPAGWVYDDGARSWEKLISEAVNAATRIGIGGILASARSPEGSNSAAPGNGSGGSRVVVAGDGHYSVDRSTRDFDLSARLSPEEIEANKKYVQNYNADATGPDAYLAVDESTGEIITPESGHYAFESNKPLMSMQDLGAAMAEMWAAEEAERAARAGQRALDERGHEVGTWSRSGQVLELDRPELIVVERKKLTPAQTYQLMIQQQGVPYDISPYFPNREAFKEAEAEVRQMQQSPQMYDRDARIPYAPLDVQGELNRRAIERQVDATAEREIVNVFPGPGGLLTGAARGAGAVVGGRTFYEGFTEGAPQGAPLNTLLQMFSANLAGPLPPRGAPVLDEREYIHGAPVNPHNVRKAGPVEGALQPDLPIPAGPNVFHVPTRTGGSGLSADVSAPISATAPNVSEYGVLLGKPGSFKNAYLQPNGRVLVLLRDRTYNYSIPKELEALKRIRELFADTDIIHVNAGPPIMRDGRLGYEMDRFEQSSRELLNVKVGTRQWTADTSPYLNQRSIDDLETIRRVLVEKEVQIPDLQFLIRADGRIAIADPLDVPEYSPEGPSDVYKRQIELLQDAARRSIAARGY